MYFMYHSQHYIHSNATTEIVSRIIKADSKEEAIAKLEENRVINFCISELYGVNETMLRNLD